MAALSASAMPTRTSPIAPPPGSLGRRQQPALRRDDRRRGVQPRAVHRVDGRAVRADQRGGESARSRSGSGSSKAMQCSRTARSTTADDRCLDLRGTDPGAPDPALGLGAQVPDLPGRPLALDRRHHPCGQLVQQPVGRTGRAVAGRATRAPGAPSGPGRPPSPAPPRPRRATPPAAPPRERGGVLGLPGLQGGLLGQRDRLHRRRRATVALLEPDGQHPAASLDRGRPRRPAAASAGSTPTTSRTGRFPHRASRAREPQPRAADTSSASSRVL